jgi:hypothetical protein
MAGCLITGIFRFTLTTLPARNFAPEQFQLLSHHDVLPGSSASSALADQVNAAGSRIADGYRGHSC